MINRLSYSRLGNISFIALVTISYFVPRSLRSLVTKYDIVSRAIKLISPRLSYDNLYLSYIYIYTLDCVSCVLFCSSHAMTSSVIYYSTDARKNEIYLLIILLPDDRAHARETRSSIKFLNFLCWL